MIKVTCDRCGLRWNKENTYSARIVGQETVDLCDSCSEKLNILYESIEVYEGKRLKVFMEEVEHGIVSK